MEVWQAESAGPQEELSETPGPQRQIHRSYRVELQHGYPADPSLRALPYAVEQTLYEPGELYFSVKLPPARGQEEPTYVARANYVYDLLQSVRVAEYAERICKRSLGDKRRMLYRMENFLGHSQGMLIYRHLSRKFTIHDRHVEPLLLLAATMSLPIEHNPLAPVQSMYAPILQVAVRVGVVVLNGGFQYWWYQVGNGRLTTRPYTYLRGLQASNRERKDRAAALKEMADAKVSGGVQQKSQKPAVPPVGDAKGIKTEVSDPLLPKGKDGKSDHPKVTAPVKDKPKKKVQNAVPPTTKTPDEKKPDVRPKTVKDEPTASGGNGKDPATAPAKKVIASPLQRMYDKNEQDTLRLQRKIYLPVEVVQTAMPIGKHRWFRLSQFKEYGITGYRDPTTGQQVTLRPFWADNTAPKLTLGCLIGRVGPFYWRPPSPARTISR